MQPRVDHAIFQFLAHIEDVIAELHFGGIGIGNAMHGLQMLEIDNIGRPDPSLDGTRAAMEWLIDQILFGNIGHFRQVV